MTFDTSPTLRHYLSAVKRFPRLTRPGEEALWEAWLTKGDQRAKTTLIQANLRFVVTIAFRYRHYDLPVSELIAEGNVGILHAVAKFDPNRKLRFVTYAVYWIRAFILRHIIYSWSLVGGGSGGLHSKRFFKLRRERARILSLVGDQDLATKLLAERFNCTEPQITKMLEQVDTRDLSIDSPIRGDSTTNLRDTLISRLPNQEEQLFRCQDARLASQLATAALETLNPRERYVIENRFMADSDKSPSLAELGRTLGISRERVRQLETRALGRMRTVSFASLIAPAAAQSLLCSDD